MDTKSVNRKFNVFTKKYNEFYHRYVRHTGLTETVLDILYFTDEENGGITQTELSAFMGLPVQTVNSALKKLERDGIVTLSPSEANRKIRLVRLTEAGERLCREAVDPFKALEEEVLSRFSEEELSSLDRLMERYQENLDAVMKEEKLD